MLFVWDYVKQHKKLLSLTILGAVFFVLVNLGLPTILAIIINDVIINQDTGQFYFLIGLMAFVIVFGLFGNIMVSYSSSRLTNLMTKAIRNDLYDKISDFSHTEYETIGVSSLVTRLHTINVYWEYCFNYPNKSFVIMDSSSCIAAYFTGHLLDCKNFWTLIR